MIDVLLMAPCVKVLAALLVVRVAWWVLGDFLLEHVGVPFLDAGWSRADARAGAVTETPDREAVARVARWIERPAGSGSRTAHAGQSVRRSATHDEQRGTVRAAHDRARRRTGMSREVRAW